MPTDFSDAANRHWKDGCYLYADSRLANADQMFGFSAECALKAVMIGLGSGVDTKDAPSGYDKHINKLWVEFATFAQSRGGARYSATISGIQNPFATWLASQRYFHHGDITQPSVDSHRNGAKIAMNVLSSAVLDGVVL